jgi:FlaA1/EpsC-like NDP-sugar epimerase
MPRSVIILGSLLSLTGFGTVRFQNRLFAIRRLSAVDDRARILLVGAGEAGAMVVKDVFRNPSAGLIPVGLIDDDRRKMGRKLNGVEVLANRSSIPYLVPKLKVDQVFLTIPSANSEVVQDVAALCEEAEVPLQVLPSAESFNGKVSVRDMRDLRIEDLLGRQQVDTDLAGVARMLTGKRVLITGAGGSIGSEIVRQVASFDPAKLILLDNDETHLHDVITQLDSDHGVAMVLGDVRG